MTTPIAAHKTDVLLERDVTSVTIGNGDVLDGVTSASITVDGQSTEISELGEAGVRRLLGRADFTVDLDINFDPSDDGTSNAANGHQGLLNDSKDDTILYGVSIDFDSTSSSSFAIGAACKVATADISADDGALTMSVSLETADGAEWTDGTI